MSQNQQNHAFDLDDYQWKNRLLLIFAETESENSYKNQLNEFQDQQAGFDDRNLKVFHLFKNDQSFGDEKSISNSKTIELFDRFEVLDHAFVVILIGKDGTEKLRTKSVLNTDKLFSVVDAMPMRQQEMRNSDGK
ncbi:MAG: DUF4174 domain-containing protein [Balneolaceae bacterium]|nr:DUF4174 domain-containing protein [Balneolaceae bacterium]